MWSGGPVLVRRGVGAMEIVAMDMKVSGMYIARQLSFSGVTFRIEEIPLAPAFERVYNRAALLVSRVAGLCDHTDTSVRVPWELCSRPFSICPRGCHGELARRDSLLPPVLL